MSKLVFFSTFLNDIRHAAGKAVLVAIPNPRTACLFALRVLKLDVVWAYKFDRALPLPFQYDIESIFRESPFNYTIA
jgi:type I restriction enzyme R subunit